MTLLQCLQHVRNFDYFSTKEFFRYKGSQQYQSFFGGFLSFALLCFLMAMFYNNITQCLNRQIIYSTQTLVTESDPSEMNITTYPKDRFMLAVGVVGLDLNFDRVRYFDVILTNRLVYTTDEGWKTDTKQIMLEPCTIRHFKGYPQIMDDLKKVNLGRLKCMPMNSTVSLNGKYISKDYRTIEIRLQRCSDGYEPTRRCATDYEMYKLWRAKDYYKMNLYFPNVLINADSPDYMQYFLEDRYFSSFSRFKGGDVNMFIQDYKVTTDHDIYPLENTEQTVETGLLVDQEMNYKRMKVDDYQIYSRFFIFKSSISRIYTRSFYQVEEVLALVGGLFGVAAACLFFVNTYNFSAFQVAITAEIFKPNQEEADLFEKYSFSSFLMQGIFGILQSIGFKPNWKATIEYNSCEKEINKQIDSVYMLERLWHLETAVSTILEDHQVKALHLRKKMTVEQAKEHREAMALSKEVKKLGEKKLEKKKRRIRSESLRMENEKNLSKVGLVNSMNLDSPSKNGDESMNHKGMDSSPPLQVIDLNKGKNWAQMNELLSEDMSSDISESPRVREQKEKMLSELMKIRSEAGKGERISRRIMELTNSKVAELMKYQKEQQAIEEVSEVSEVSEVEDKFINPIVLKDGSLNGEDEQKKNEEQKNKSDKALNNNDEKLDLSPLEMTKDEQQGLSPNNQVFNFKNMQQNIENQSVLEQYYQQQQEYEQEQEKEKTSNKDQMDSLIKSIKNVIKNQDIFCTKEFFRYKDQLQYKTHFGGAVSVFMFLGMALMTYNKVLDCLNKTTLTSSTDRSFSSSPSILTLSTYPIANFMALVKIQPYDFEPKDTRYFDIFLDNYYRVYNQSTGEYTEELERHQLERCTEDHFLWMPNGTDIIELIGVYDFMCFPMNKTFLLQGKQTSLQYRSLELSIRKCSNQTGFAIPCNDWANDQDFFDYLDVTFSLYITNPILTPNSENYLNYYLEDQLVATINQYTINSIRMFFSSFQVNTDNSIWPLTTDTETITGSRFDYRPSVIKYAYESNQTDFEFLKMKFLRSPSSVTITRSYEKVIDVFALVGGLFSLITACLFIVNSYNNYAYQISIAAKLFKTKIKDKRFLKRYNFLSFIKQSLFELIQNFGNPPKWKETEEYLKCQREVEKQLDVLYLVERFEFIESAISTVMQPHELKMLHLKERPSIRDAKQHRKNMKIKRQFRKQQLELNADIKRKQRFEVFLAKKRKAAEFILSGGNSQSVTPMSLLKKNEVEAVSETQIETLASIRKADDSLQDEIGLIDNNDILSDISDSENSVESEISDDSAEDKREILKQLKRINAEAIKGEPMSKRIMQLTEKKVGALFGDSPRKQSLNDSRLSDADSIDMNEQLIRKESMEMGRYKKTNKMSKFAGKDKAIKKRGIKKQKSRKSMEF